MTGSEYAEYLSRICEYYSLPIHTDTEVYTIERGSDTYLVKTDKDEYRSTFLIWAGGESQYPHISAFPGADICLHYIDVPTWE